MAAEPQVETIVIRNDFEEAPLERREIWRDGDHGAGIGLSAGSVDPIPNQNQPTGGLVVPQPVTPNAQPGVIIPVPPPITPPVTPSANDVQEIGSGQEINIVPQLPVNPNVSANRQVRQLACMNWFFGLGGTRPYWCDTASPGIAPGF